MMIQINTYFAEDGANDNEVVPSHVAMDENDVDSALGV